MRLIFSGIFLLLILTAVQTARAQEVELAYDDGSGSGVVETIGPGDIEVVRFTALHPCQFNSIRLYFQTSGVARIHI
ncbi:MAG: hypothetical protein ACQES9_10900 [Myxococcota bacterium]